MAERPSGKGASLSPRGKLYVLDQLTWKAQLYAEELLTDTAFNLMHDPDSMRKCFMNLKVFCKQLTDLIEIQEIRETMEKKNENK